ncbi:ABC transporter permease [Actinoplanes philippinensis]|uniref:Fructose transport system permease protein n=1 Tax=Actinoplanes philippinensis TaxID=35752 RepID=A0A1I2IV11_9ACTN|nr:ABC transporter permease [Actinoplanes philippinensis]GIE78941.1 ABC transporter permease [Actinoplanes philippinensis]SFF45580.1 fructose transport system permease protein [Actinoplanes philippinensis]
MTATADFEVRRHDSFGLRLQHLLHGNPVLGPLAVLIVAIVAFSIVNARFFSAANLSLVLLQVTVIATLALGQTLIILTAGIDLSAGAIAVFSSILMAIFATDAGVPAPLALLLGFACGTAMGAVNGLLVTRIKLPPFIVTLGTLTIFFSLNAVVSNSETIRGADMPALMTWTGQAIPIGSFRLSYGSIIMLLLFGFFAYALSSTAWGKHVYATGDDVEAARLAGIRTGRVLFSVYTTAGLLYAVAGWILIGRLASASPNVGTEYNLDSITAVVLGGTSLFGGRGGVIGTLIGALIVGVFRNGLQLAGVEVVWQGFAIGLLVLIAVSLDQWIRKVRS